MLVVANKICDSLKLKWKQFELWCAISILFKDFNFCYVRKVWDQREGLVSGKEKEAETERHRTRPSTGLLPKYSREQILPKYSQDWAAPQPGVSSTCVSGNSQDVCIMRKLKSETDPGLQQGTSIWDAGIPPVVPSSLLDVRFLLLVYGYLLMLKEAVLWI